MSLEKDVLRKKLLQVRKSFSFEQVKAWSALVEKNLWSLDVFCDSKCVLWYVSFDGEVHTHEMIRRCLYESRCVVVPVSVVSSHELKLSALESFDELVVGSYGILEPSVEYRRCVDASCLDVVIVPGVGFDVCGGRLGHGGGYYDRFLKNRSVVKIGLCFEELLVQSVPMDEFDVGVDVVVTEKRVVNCSNCRKV